MEVKKMMSGSIDYLTRDKVNPQLLNFVEILESYDLVKNLADEKAEETEKAFILHDINGMKVQSVLGKNYRVNLYKDSTVELTFSKRNSTAKMRELYKEKLKEFNIKNTTSLKPTAFGVVLKSIIIIDKETKDENILELFSLFNIK